MPFETNNEYWKLRSKDGKDKKYKTPQELAEKANEYFSWCIDHPLKEQVVHGKESKIIELNRMRPFTIQGLCNFLDMSVKAFNLYEKRDDYVPITTRIRQIIYNQKFEGSAAGFLNANIIARDLGLVDKKDHTTAGESIKATIKFSDDRDAGS